MLSYNQKTINKPIKLSGVGLHNGINADLLIKPAEENFGIKFHLYEWAFIVIKYMIFCLIDFGNHLESWKRALKAESLAL